MVSLIYKSDFNHHTKSKHIRVCSDFRKEQVGNKVTVLSYSKSTSSPCLQSEKDLLTLSTVSSAGDQPVSKTGVCDDYIC